MPKGHKTTTADRRAKVQALRERLEQFEADLDETAVAQITARWSGYSPRNALLIAMQCAEATDVAGFKTWLGRGRCVRKGEHGIQILSPAGVTDDEVDDAGRVTRAGRQLFKLAYVFDVSQTDPLPVSATAAA